MSGAEWSLKRSRPNLQLEHKQRQTAVAGRGQQEAHSPGWVTPRGKKEKNKDQQLPRSFSRHASAPESGHSPSVGHADQRPSTARNVSFRADNVVVDKTRDTRRRKPDARRLSHTPIRHVSDGPVLQARRKALYQDAFLDEHAGEIDPSLSYAQALQSSIPRFTRHVQTAPATSSEEFPAQPALEDIIIPQLNLPRQESLDDESDAGPSIFDDEQDETDKLSDFATEISSSTVSDYGLPPDLDPDERLVNPHKYMSELADLEATVAGNSGLFLMKKINRQRYPLSDEHELHFKFDCFSPCGKTIGLVSYDNAIIANLSSQRGKRDFDQAFHLLECRNLMLAVISNVERLRATRFCQDTVNVLVVSTSRPQVARLVDIQLTGILRLHKSFEKVVRKLAAQAGSGGIQIDADLDSRIKNITHECTALLDKLGLPHASSSPGTWRKAVMVLDLAVVSYSGAHIERFDDKFLEEDLDFAKITTAWTYDRQCPEGIMLRRRQLRCLDGFLGQPVWVLQNQTLWRDSHELYLSASIDQFADIWGPVWSAKTSEDSADVMKYHAGPGVIMACHPSAESPKAEADEILCHWIHRNELPLETEQLPLETEPPPISPHLRLLIGASTVVEQTTSQLKENELCKNRTNMVVQQLRQMNCIEELGTRKPTMYVSEHQVTAQIGYSGMAIGGSKVYKRQHGISLKEAIVDAWRHGGGTRNPVILEQWLGVEVSFCTRNARRRRLKQILNSTTMRNWLEACRNRDHLPCDHAFSEALSSSNPHAFKELYSKHKEWRQDLGQLVSWCLEGLLYSNVDADRVLRVLWMPRSDQRYRVKVRHNPNSWTGLLVDTEEMCSMAIMSGKCLHTDYRDASICQAQTLPPGRSNSTIFETAVRVNEAAPRPKGLELRASENEKTRQARWSISRVPRGEKFVLDSCRLRVIEPFARTRLLVQWEAGVMGKLHSARQQVARTIGKETLYHWELKSDSAEEEWPTKPIPLFVVSQFENKR
ncbi:MAG: hypothetical protein M1820_002051 [Bogoriella megaspora]|nr:MAG: hypothetical protein M1820_002051 [Bogoriella megaspora]